MTRGITLLEDAEAVENHPDRGQAQPPPNAVPGSALLRWAIRYPGIHLGEDFSLAAPF